MLQSSPGTALPNAYKWEIHNIFSAVPRFLSRGGGSADIVSHFWGGRDDTYKSVIVTMSHL